MTDVDILTKALKLTLIDCCLGCIESEGLHVLVRRFRQRVPEPHIHILEQKMQKLIAQELVNLQ